MTRFQTAAAVIPIDREQGDADTITPTLRRPVVAGLATVLILVVGLLAGASTFRIAGAVNAAAVVRVEDNSKVLKSREGGVVGRIFVHEGEPVRRGDVLIRLDPVQAEANSDMSRGAYDSALANIARLQAEAADAPRIRFPDALAALRREPGVAALLDGQRALFTTRRALVASQVSVLHSQADQLVTQIDGLHGQMASLDMQSGLIDEELADVRGLAQLGYAPKNRILALQRSAAELRGQHASLVSEVGRARQSIDALRLQVAQLDDKRAADAADGIRQEEEKLAEAAPKLRATAQALAQTLISAPVEGVVFNLSQFTEGGVVQPGEPLLQIVPTGKPLILTARVQPGDIANVRVGLPVRITLSAYNPRTTPPVDGRVAMVAADAAADETTHESAYMVQIRIDPKALASAGSGIRLVPGMTASVSIVTGSRTILDYLLGPMMLSLRSSLSES